MRLGSYELLNEIGRGGLGAVYRARATDGRVVAIKVLIHPEARGALERFERERRLLAEVGEGFVPILDAGASPQGPFIVMPFIEGGTLRERLMRSGALPAAETLALGRKLAAALARAHARGIVHRDLKPENILYTTLQEPLVADLGLAKHFTDSAPGAAQSVSLSKTGIFRGTPGYMAVEQMQDSKNVGPAADVFALGAILHECLSGESAFAGETPLEVIGRIERGERRPIASKDAPPFLLEAIAVALEADPEDRFEDAQAFLDALDGSSGPSRAPRGLLVVLAVAALAAIAATTALVLARWTPADKPSSVEDDTPKDVPPPGPDLPAQARGFARSKRTSLARVLGSWSFRGLAGPPGPLALTPDGKSALVATQHRAFLFDLETGEERLVLPDHGALVTAVAISPDGKLAVTGTKTHSVPNPVDEPSRTPPAYRLFELPSGRLVETIVASPAGVSALAFGRGRFVAGLLDGSYESIQLEPRERKTAATNKSPVAGVTASLEGGQSLVAINDDMIELLPGEPVRTFRTKVITGLAASRDGKKAATVHIGGGIRVWNVATWMPVAMVHAHEGAIASVAFSPDEAKVVTAGADRHVKVWDLHRMSQEAPSLDRDIVRAGEYPRWAAQSVAWTPDGKKIAVRAWDSALHVYDAVSGAELAAREGHREIVFALALSPDGKVLLSGSRDDSLRGWDPETGKLLWTEWPEIGELWDIEFLPGGRERTHRGAEFITAGHRVRRWDLATHKEVFSVGPTGTSFISIAPLDSARNTGGKESEVREFMAGSVGGHVVRGDLATGAAIKDFDGHCGWARNVGITPRGWIGGVESKKIALRDFESGAVICALDGSEPVVEDLVVSPGGERVVAIGGSRLLVWDLPATLPPFLAARELRGHEGGIRGLAITKDGKRAASGGRDGTIRLWDLERGREIDRIDLGTATDEAWSLTFDASGRTLWAGTARGVILRFEVR